LPDSQVYCFASNFTTDNAQISAIALNRTESAPHCCTKSERKKSRHHRSAKHDPIKKGGASRPHALACDTLTGGEAAFFSSQFLFFLLWQVTPRKFYRNVCMTNSRGLMPMRPEWAKKILKAVYASKPASCTLQQPFCTQKPLVSGLLSVEVGIVGSKCPLYGSPTIHETRFDALTAFKIFFG